MTVRMRFAAIEGAHLLALVDQLRELLSAQILGSVDDDPAIARLTPVPYPEDPDAAADFSRATRSDLLDRRSEEARLVSAALAPFGDPASIDVEEPVASHDIDIAVTDLGAWMRTLNALRLVLATRLGIVDEDDIDEDDPRRGVYDWLGYRLELLVQAAEVAG